MSEKEKAQEAFAKTTLIKAKAVAAAPTYRTVLIAASMGVLLGLLLKR
jgi:ElaB/YqjD/DUF883 family membrane-anchored ribosome-binding protein